MCTLTGAQSAQCIEHTQNQKPLTVWCQNGCGNGTALYICRLFCILLNINLFFWLILSLLQHSLQFLKFNWFCHKKQIAQRQRFYFMEFCKFSSKTREHFHHFKIIASFPSKTWKMDDWLLDGWVVGWWVVVWLDNKWYGGWGMVGWLGGWMIGWLDGWVIRWWVVGWLGEE